MRSLLAARAAGILCRLSAFLCGMDHRQDTRCMQRSGTRASRRCAVPESDNWRKYELECMRLAADCMQLVGDVHNPALQSLFLRMARVWSNLAEQGPGAATQTSAYSRTRNRNKRSYPVRARISRQQPAGHDVRTQGDLLLANPGPANARSRHVQLTCPWKPAGFLHLAPPFWIALNRS